MPDLHTRYYLGPSEQAFLAVFTRLLDKIIGRAYAANIPRGNGARAILDVLQGWMPLNAGSGSLSLSPYDIAQVTLEVRDGDVTIKVAPRSLLSMRVWTPRLALSLTRAGGVMSDPMTMGYVNNLLRLITRRAGEVDTHTSFVAYWMPESTAQPSPMWIERRRVALLTRALPPRAVHWMGQAPGV